MKTILAAIIMRGLQAIIVAVIVGIVSFVMMHALPGDAAYRISAARYGYDTMDASAAEAVRTELGLDRSIPEQLGSWLAALARFDLGDSLVYGTRVSDEVRAQMGYTLLLAGSSVLASLIIALPLGVAAGLRPGGLVDRAALGLSIFIRAIPAFAVGVLLVLIFALQLGWLPVAGFLSPQHLILPSLTIGIGLAAVSNRVVRDAVVDCMSADWRLFARTKGLSSHVTLIRHVLLNAALPVVTYVGVQTAYLIEGVVIVESVFAWPGIGHALMHAIFARDVAMVQGTALTLGLLYVVLNFGIDLVCHSIDPRRRTT